LFVDRLHPCKSCLPSLASGAVLTSPEGPSSNRGSELRRQLHCQPLWQRCCRLDGQGQLGAAAASKADLWETWPAKRHSPLPCRPSGACWCQGCGCHRTQHRSFPFKPSRSASNNCQSYAQDRVSICVHSSLFICGFGWHLPVCILACLTVGVFVHVCLCAMLCLAHQSCKRKETRRQGPAA
jgi:hypothetical protein